MPMKVQHHLSLANAVELSQMSNVRPFEIITSIMKAANHHKKLFANGFFTGATRLQDKETDRVNKYAEPQEKVLTTPNNVEPFTYSTQDLTPPTQFYTVQGTVQEDTPVVRIHASRIGEVSTGEVSSGADDCILISGSAEDFYNDLGTLFTDLEPADEKVGKIHVDFVTVAVPLDDTIGFERYAHSPDSSSKRTRWKSLNSLDAGIGARKKAGMISEGPAGFDGMIAGRWVGKSEDHG